MKRIKFNDEIVMFYHSEKAITDKFGVHQAESVDIARDVLGNDSLGLVDNGSYGGLILSGDEYKELTMSEMFEGVTDENEINRLLDSLKW